MNSILRWKHCLVYLDDVIIFAKNLEELNRRLDAVLARLEDAGVNLNAAKCQFLQEKTTFLGEGKPRGSNNRSRENKRVTTVSRTK